MDIPSHRRAIAFECDGRLRAVKLRPAPRSRQPRITLQHPLRIAVIGMLCAVLFGAMGCGGSGVDTAAGLLRGAVPGFAPAYTPPLVLGENEIDPIAPETRTFKPGFCIRSLLLEGGAPFSGRQLPAFANASPNRVEQQPGSQRQRTRSLHVPGGLTAGLPVSSHMKIAGANQKWLERCAAMTKARAPTHTKLKTNSYFMRKSDM